MVPLYVHLIICCCASLRNARAKEVERAPKYIDAIERLIKGKHALSAMDTYNDRIEIL